MTLSTALPGRSRVHCSKEPYSAPKPGRTYLPSTQSIPSDKTARVFDNGGPGHCCEEEEDMAAESVARNETTDVFLRLQHLSLTWATGQTAVPPRAVKRETRAMLSQTATSAGHVRKLAGEGRARGRIEALAVTRERAVGVTAPCHTLHCCTTL